MGEGRGGEGRGVGGERGARGEGQEGSSDSAPMQLRSSLALPSIPSHCVHSCLISLLSPHSRYPAGWSCRLGRVSEKVM